ncbi:hypothetical protein DL771_007663 [Monosporascus sp. 5C6A]|nr:hypothetical protein DL771_007663 [Monosporascus sp. 5C6A]
MNSVVLVDLRNEREVSRIRKILNGAMDPGREFKWQWLMVNRKYDWYRNGRSGGLPVPHEIGEDWDENDQCIEATLSRLLEIRPTFVIRNQGKALLRLQSRQRVNGRPNVYWDDGEWREGFNLGY